MSRLARDTARDGGQGLSADGEGQGSGQVPVWKVELMGLADGLDTGGWVKGESSWGLSSRRNGAAMHGDGEE